MPHSVVSSGAYLTLVSRWVSCLILPLASLPPSLVKYHFSFLGLVTICWGCPRGSLGITCHRSRWWRDYTVIQLGDSCAPSAEDCLASGTRFRAPRQCNLCAWEGDSCIASSCCQPAGIRQGLWSQSGTCGPCPCWCTFLFASALS